MDEWTDLNRPGLAIEDDTVVYELYPDTCTSEGDLQQLCQEYLDAVERELEGYIWQRDSFNLQASTSRPQPWLDLKTQAARRLESSAPCVWGRTCYGDNVEDEWLITWLLMKLSGQFKLSARAWDSDGDFLLIEAAYTLPKWLKPETAENRVWFRDGMMHIIPPPSPQLPSLPAAPNKVEALQILNSSIPTTAPTTMQAAIASRVGNYPSGIQKNMHHAAVTVPAEVASMLQQQPQLVANVVEAFYYRDPSDMKAARQMAHFDLEKELVDTVVRFSRCLYAQMAAQSFQPPRNYPMPFPSEPNYAAAQLGLKLTAGFEMLLARLPEGTSIAEAADLKDIQGSAEWQKFLQGLADKGFFENEMKGSKKHTALMQAAAEKFRTTDAYQRHAASYQEPSLRIAAMLSKNQPFEPSKVSAQAESDAWMAEGSEEIERQLKKRQLETGDVDPSDDLAEKFKNFLGSKGGFEGIDEDILSDDKPVELNDEAFLREMMRAFNRHEPGEGDMSDEEGSSFYGDYSEDSGDEGITPPDFDPSFKAQAGKKARQRLSIEGILQGVAVKPSTSKSRSRQTEDSGRNGTAYARQTKQSPIGEEFDDGAATATDSDDESCPPNYFDEAYNEALRSEMRNSHTSGLPASSPAGGGDNDLTPIDLDMNLVQNLLASYEAQEGMPGPVGNIAGLMGLSLPSQKRSQ